MLLPWPAAAVALGSELLLLITHAKVLLCLGQPYSADDLRSKRCTYFAADAASPWLALAALMTMKPRVGSSATWMPLLLGLLAGHLALHAFYMARWHSRAGREVLAMSAVDSMTQRRARFSAPRVAWFVAGTSWDIATHGAMSCLLLHRLATAAA